MHNRQSFWSTWHCFQRSRLYEGARRPVRASGPRKTAINGAMQPAVLLMMRYWPPPMLAGALFQNPLENLVMR